VDLGFANRDFTGREWLLPKIADWLDSPDGGKFLLITGPPGAGKTALCAWLCGAGPEPDGSSGDLLSRIRGTWNSVQFCGRRFEGASIDPRSYVRHLATDLALTVPAYAQAVLRAVPPSAAQAQVNVSVSTNLGKVVGLQTDHLWISGRSIMDGFSESVKAPIELLAHEAPGSTLAILIDGLDEALTFGGTSIPHLIASLADLPNNIKVLVTAKTDRRIRDLFPSGMQEIDLADPALEDLSRRDVLAYVRRRVTGAQDAAVGQWQAEEIAAAAGANFQYARHLLDEITSGNLGSSSSRPKSLAQLYSAYLDQLIPNSGGYGGGEKVRTDYLPILALLSVLLAPIPIETAAVVLQWSVPAVATRVDELQQLIDFGHVGSSELRFFHSSMADFVGVATLPDRTPNRYHTPAAEAHAVVARRYLEILSSDPGASGGLMDQYGLTYLAEHIRSGIGPGLMRPDQLYGLAMNLSYREAQQRTGSVDAMLRTATTALDHAVETGDDAALAQLVEAFATAAEPQLHGLSAGVLALANPAVGNKEILRLLAHPSPSARQVALNAAYQLGFRAEELFESMALSRNPDLPRMVAYMAYLNWSQGEHEIVMRFSERIASQIRLRAPGDARRRLSFLADITIILYINLPHDRRLISWGDGLWWDLLIHKLHIRKLNHWLIATLVLSVAANTIAQRLGEAVMVDAMQSPSAYFEGGPKPRELLSRAIELLDPHSDLRAEYGTLTELLGSDIAFLRVIGAIVLSSHCSRSLTGLQPFLVEHFPQLTPRARLWHLIAFGVVSPTNTDWRSFVAWQTEYVLEHDRATIVSRDAGALRTLNFVLLPLGLACGKAGAFMTEVKNALAAAVHRGDVEFATVLIEALGVVGLYYPVQALGPLREISDSCSGALEDSLVDALAVINVLYPQAVDLFLEETGLGERRVNVRSMMNVVSTRRTIDQAGFFNSAIYQAARNPIMRERLTKPALRCLNESQSIKQFARKYTKILLDLAREYDYHPGDWTVEE